MEDRQSAARSLGDPETKDKLRQVVRPNSISRTLRKAGVALLLSPDPITDIPGAIMLGASIAAKKKDPMSASSVLEEARKLMSEIDESI